jgi:hypothetical protein
MLKLGEVFHVIVAAGVKKKYHPAGVSPLSGRLALLSSAGSPLGNVVCEPTVIDDPPPVTAAAAVTLPLNPPEPGIWNVPPLAAITTVQGLLEGHGVAVGTGVGMGLVPPPPPPPPPQATRIAAHAKLASDVRAR